MTRYGLLFCVLFSWAGGCTPEQGTPITGDATRGETLFAQADGVGPSCQSCHCPDASGGCRLNAPDLRGVNYDTIDQRTRDPSVSHPGGKFSFTDQDLADLAAYLGSLAP